MSTARIRLITLAVVASLGAGTALAADSGTRNSVTPPAPDSTVRVVPTVGGVGKKVAVSDLQRVLVRKGKLLLKHQVTGRTLVVRNGSILIVRGLHYRVVGTKLVRIKKKTR